MAIQIQNQPINQINNKLMTKYIHSRRSQNQYVLPVKFNVDKIQSIEISEDLTFKIGEYIVRSGKRY